MRTHPAPGRLLRLPSWRVTGSRKSDVPADVYYGADLRVMDVEAQPPGEPLSACSGLEVPIAMTPAMFGALAGAGAEYPGDYPHGRIAGTPPWVGRGRRVRPPPRAIVLVGRAAYPDQLGPALKAALGARLEAAGIWCGWYYATTAVGWPQAPGMGYLPQTGNRIVRGVA